MRITSRNVNWIRSVAQKGFVDFIKSDNPDVFCLQETKAFEHQMPDSVKELLSEYDYCWHAGTRPWYAWTVIFWKKSVLNDVVTCNAFSDNLMFYEDGRVTEINRWEYTLLNIYFPNGWTRADGTEMLSYKLKFYDCLIQYIQYKHSTWKKVITVGDYNICHTEIDIARPKENENTIWFLPVERKKVTQFLQETNVIDVYRTLHPGKLEEYTWWSTRAGARPRNVWRRIDYVTVSKELESQIIWFEHQMNQMWSDHCPVSVELKI